MRIWISNPFLYCFGIFVILHPLHAKDFGVLGQTFSIQEESLLAFLQKSFSPEVFAQKKQALTHLLLENAKNPAPVKAIQEARTYRSFQIDLTFRVERDIEDGKGKVLIKKGTTVNPLEQIKLTEGLLFFDGGQERHINWAKQQQGDFKWVLVSGKPFEIEEREKRPIYFDQQGKYCQRFQIRNVPSKVTQKGVFLLIEEMPVIQGENP